MEKIINELNEWLDGLKQSKLPVFEDLPDVSLYMDQVVSYVDGILEPYSRDEQKLITSFMVNNYVKAKIIEPPHAKRYEKNQLSYLIAICLLKQITSMSNMAVLLRKDSYVGNTNEFYDQFINVHNSIKNSVYEKTMTSLDKIEKGEKFNSRGRRKKDVEVTPVSESLVKKNLIDLSLKLMIESELNKMIAERILYELGKEDYSETKLFEQKAVEKKFDKKRTIKETKRVKRANHHLEKKNKEDRGDNY